MTCLECNRELGYLDHRNAMETYGLELCGKHKKRIDDLSKKHQTPREAVKLYYGLKEAGLKPMLEWWDGEKSVHLAISRVKLNIDIDTEYEMLTYEQALTDLENKLHSYKDGFTTIRIPDALIRNYLKETVENVLGIVEGLKERVKLI